MDVPEPADSVPTTVIALNDPPGAAGTIILRPPGVGDGVPSHRTAFPIGMSVAVTGGVLVAGTEVFVALTGQAATVSQGTLTRTASNSVALIGQSMQVLQGGFPSYLLDNFTGTDGDLLDAHVPDLPSGNAVPWTLVTGTPPYGNKAYIQSNRATIDDTTFFASAPQQYKSINIGAASASLEQCVEAEFYYYQSGVNNTYAGIIASAGGASGDWSFGWNENAGQWELKFGVFVQVTSTTSAFTTPGESKVIRLELMGTSLSAGDFASPLLVKAYVDDVEIISHTSSGGTPTGHVGFIFGAGDSEYRTVDINWIKNLQISRTLTGQVATVTGGTLVGVVTGGSSVGITGMSAAVTGGALGVSIEAPLVGQAATVSKGTIVPNVGDAFATLVGQSATVSQGVFGKIITIGASEQAPAAPVIIDANIYTKALGGPFLMFIQRAQNNPISINGTLKWTAEYHSRESIDPYIPGSEGSRRFGASFSQKGGAFSGEGWVPGGQYHISYYGVPDAYTPAPLAAVGKYLLPNGEMYDCGLDFGGHFSADKDGGMHWFHTRGFGRLAHGNGTYDYMLYVYQNDLSVEHSLPKAAVRYPESGAVMSNPGTMGLYAHTATNASLFYTSHWHDGGTLTGLRASVTGGVITAAQDGAPLLTGQSITVRQGILAARGTGTTPLLGRSVTVSGGVITPTIYQHQGVPNLSDMPVVPTYRRTDGYEWGPEIKIGEQPPVGDMLLYAPPITDGNITMRPPQGIGRAVAETMCVTRSGYDDVIYLAYLNTTVQGLATVTYVSVVVMHAVTGFVYGHQRYRAPLFTFDNTRPTRPLAEVVRLSTGRSLTQFMLGRACVNITWDASTFLTPTIVTKDLPAPTFPLKGGWDTLEYKGDDVFHALYSTVWGLHKLNIYMTVSDATVATSPWVNIGNRGFKADASGALEAAAVMLGNSGYGGGYPSLITATTDGDNSLGGGFSVGAFAMWVDYWAAQKPYLTVKAEGQVGAVTTTIIEGTQVALTGMSCTVTQNPLAGIEIATNNDFVLTSDFYSGGFFIYPAGTILEGNGYGDPTVLDAFGCPIQKSPSGWGGLRATVTGGIIFFAVPGSGALVGMAANVTGGVLSPSIDKALTGQAATVSKGTLVPLNSEALTGLPATVSGGVVSVSTSVTVALVGQSVTVNAGVPVPAIDKALVGQAATVSKGTMGTAGTTAFAGQSCAVTGGTMVPSISVSPSGMAVTATGGLLSPAMVLRLTGAQATVTKGVFTINADCNLFPSGVQAAVVLGEYTTNVPPIPLDGVHQLFTQTIPEAPTVDVEVPDLFNDT